ncbi:MAG TPA: hypothetical protein VFU47_17745 [Armatimonadota bacterium]|nr:hypothetical protein [Armatimonadota bacterium]
MEAVQSSPEKQAWYWEEIQIGTLQVHRGEPPASPEVGQGWYDEETECLYVWDGAEWVCMAAD